jgi:hypothetical protein
MRILAVAVGLVALLTACGPPDSIPQGEYAQRVAEVYCERTRECARGAFDANYFGMEDCEEHARRLNASVVEDLDELGCDYDAKKAADLWVKMHDMSCENFYEGEYLEDADEVWGDCF